MKHTLLASGIKRRNEKFGWERWINESATETHLEGFAQTVPVGLHKPDS
jgi:hypothetical protein